LINNRQNGRRRGRGGGGPRSPNSPSSPGNRQDNRSRGNATQLYDKYKAMARDAQLAGDRVQTEYYLQFADHYFRVLNETRARFEEQRRSRDDYASDEDEDQDEASVAEDGEIEEREARPERAERSERQERGERQERPERGERRARRPRREAEESQESEGEERIAIDSLPPAIAPTNDVEEPAPRRRTRRPRTEGEAEIAPAA